MPTKRVARLLRVLLAVTAASVVGPIQVASAQVNQATMAEALFRSARALMSAGNFAEACPKLAESQRIDPKLGTLMNLALCHAKEGKTASAWAEYTDAAGQAAHNGQTAREKVARQSAAELEPSLAYVTIRSSGAIPISISIDGLAMGAALVGTPIPLDPGSHVVVASADGRKPLSQTLIITAGERAQTVTVPMLEVASAGPVAIAPAPAANPTPSPPTASGAHRGHVGLGYGLIAGGSAAIVAGSVFGAVALSNKSAAGDQCSATNCKQQGLSDISSMRTFEALSTITIGAGLLAAGAGVYFVLKGGSSTDATHEAVPSAPAPAAHLEPWVGPRLGGVSLSGSF